jgi:hypothetical protein
MDIAVLLTLLGGVALAVNRLVELVKPAFEQLPDQYESIAIRVTSIGLGVVITVGGGESFNLLALSPVYGQLNPYAGLIITGVIVGGFANGWDKIASLFTSPNTTSRTETLTVEKTSQQTTPPAAKPPLPTVG